MQSIAVKNITPQNVGIKNSYNIHGGTPYSGEYEATPTLEEQAFPTQGKTMLHDFIVHAIPSNYGLITWDGSTLTVS